MVPATAWAQDAEQRTANNSVYLEVLGPAVFYSVNYDRLFGDVAGRIGAGYIRLGDGDEHITIPLTFSYVGVGSVNHMFEVGAGLTLAFGTQRPVLADYTSGPALLASAIIGYRYQPANGGFTLRLGASPVASARRLLPWPYVSLGGAF